MAMTLKPYETLRKFLLVSDNDSRNNTENLNDKLFKMRPLLDLVRNNCIKMNKSFRPKRSVVEVRNCTTWKKFISGVSRIWGEQVNHGSCTIFLYMTENIVLEPNDVERKNHFFDSW